MIACPKCKKAMSGHPALGTHARYCGLTQLELFWAKVDKNGRRGCWIWTASRKPRGYGHLRLDGKDINAHRWSYELARGPIPAGMEIMHTCDVPYCVNPDHLQVGTHRQNMMDCKAKGRNTYGEKNKRGKLTEAQARAILSEYRIFSGRKSNAKELASRYGVNVGAITAITSGRNWSHLQEQK